MLFNHQEIRPDLLRKWSYNLRWATLPEGVIPLTAADPDFRVATPVREVLARYVADGQFSYGPAEGLQSFRKALSDKYLKKHQTEFDPDLILPVDSAAFGIYLTCKTFLKPGDEAIIFDPVDFLFRYSIEAVGAKAVSFPTPAADGMIDFSGMKDLITDRTRLICLCNPLNPTGKVFQREELIQIGEIADRYGLIILSDEIWSDIIFRPHRFIPIASIHEKVARRTVTITGFSKSYGLAALRIGAVLTSDQELFGQLFRGSMHTSTIHGANVAGQVAATAAMEQGDEWLEGFVSHLEKMRDITVSELNKLPGFRCNLPQGCYVAFPDITGTGRTAEDLHRFFLENARVAVVPGLEKWFGHGAEGHIRLSFATSETILREALERLKKAIVSL